MKIILFPFSRKLPDNLPHPKSPNLIWWMRLVYLLENQGHELTQVGVAGEHSLVKDTRFDLPLTALTELLLSADTFIGIDSMGQHLAWDLGKRGIVIWGQSDPLIFGHPEHINLLKDRKYLREKQFWLWTQIPFNQDAFVEPKEVVAALTTL
jgi:ADP-heptose:LPS heptosyltransferase